MNTRLLATYVHEAGHALAALLTGRRVSGMRLEADASGTTGHIGPAQGFGRLFTSFAGYPAPAAAGMFIILAVMNGHTRWAILAAGGVGLLLFAFQRSLRGFLVTAALLAATYFTVQRGGNIAPFVLLALAGFLLAATPRHLWDLRLVRSAPNIPGYPPQEAHSDADSLAEQTHVPAIVWELIFLAITFACAYVALRKV